MPERGDVRPAGGGGPGVELSSTVAGSDGGTSNPGTASALVHASSPSRQTRSCGRRLPSAAQPRRMSSAIGPSRTPPRAMYQWFGMYSNEGPERTEAAEQTLVALERVCSIHQAAPAPAGRLQPWIHRLTLQRQHAEDALVHAVQRLALSEAMQRLEPERELPQRERAFVRQAAG